ncbi:MAG: cation-transporting P-type ATPase [Planctomycetota bacterium]|nr:cation-transporting P-type ATPase [Planctomycetota bacterium]
MQHGLPLDRLAGLSHPERGLTSPEVRERTQRFGPNDIVEVPESQMLALLRDTAKDPMLWFLVGTSVLYAVLGELAEAAVLFVSIVPLAGMDAWLHQRTRASTEGLRSRLTTRARVVRDGAEIEIPAGEVVPGDLALVVAGESFPADGVVVSATEAQVDESALTGESFPVRKAALGAWPAGADEVRLDAGAWGFAGTRLLTGRAKLRIAFTGKETLYGAIVQSAVLGSHARTPLQTAIAGLVRVLVVVAAVMCVALAGIRLVQGHGLLDAVISAMTLAVAALPEEFPVVFTVFLGVGVHRLAKRKALVRRAVSVENIGRVSTICSDKMGTITEGRLDLTHVLSAAGLAREQTLRVGALASQRDSGDPLDAAVLAVADGEAGQAVQAPIVERYPFTEDRKRATAVVEEAAGLLIATKGSPEVVLAICDLDSELRADWENRVLELATEGHKVIACASRTIPRGDWTGGEPNRGFHFAGLLAFEDPVRPGVREAVGECRDAGIHVIVVTGDHPATAQAIAREIGLASGHGRDGGSLRVVLGSDLERFLSGGADGIGQVDVVARAVPAQKLTLVRALQSAGEVVAVTGDGVNDVPALQAADIGIAMGERGTRSAREIASIVLLDDDFGTIVRAVAEGRQLFRNLQISFKYLLMVHVPLVLTAAVIPLAGFPLLYLPVHIVWLELVIHPTAMIVFQELPPPGRLVRERRLRSGAFFARSDWVVIGTVGTLLTVVIVLAYLRGFDEGRAVEHGRAMALVALSCASATMTAILSRLGTWTARAIVLGTVGLALVLVQTPVLSHWLHLTPLHLDDWLLAIAGSVLACLPLLLARRGEVGPGAPGG